MALWGGRFSQSNADSTFALSRSIGFDWRLAPYDIRSSIAHLRILHTSGLISAQSAEAIKGALDELAIAVASGAFAPLPDDEDVHSALERGLTEKLGVVGGFLRAGRSRNDQVTTDLRLFAIDHLLEIATLLTSLQVAILDKAQEYIHDSAPGFTHIQHAQPVSFGHELAKHAHAFARDLDRINDWLERTSVSSLGAGALAGSSLPLNPVATGKELGFNSTFANSIDAVSDRDYVAEALFIISLVGVHLSRIGEEWTLWASSEFAWAKVSDAYSTGSSIMPQKKNPDIAELARGKSGRLLGNLVSVMTMLKGLPFAYNRDLQEDKEPIFDSVETLIVLLPALIGMVETAKFNEKVISSGAQAEFALATEIADYLAKKAVPFAQAHEAAGECVRLCEKTGIELHELSDEQLSKIHPELGADLRHILTTSGAVASRTSSLGTAPTSVLAQISDLKDATKEAKSWISNEVARFSGMMKP